MGFIQYFFVSDLLMVSYIAPRQLAHSIFVEFFYNPNTNFYILYFIFFKKQKLEEEEVQNVADLRENTIYTVCN